jgi:DNA polymerase-3 subunit delta'
MMVAMADLYADVPASAAAIASLRAAAVRPVHAYLLVGSVGAGTKAAAVAFAASLLDPGGDTTTDPAARVLAGVHPDVMVVEREGAAISIATAREVARLSARSPVEGTRKVLILDDFHLVKDAGPALLKTIEEPPPSTVFVIIAEFVPPELVTIASRCVRIDLPPLSQSQVIAALVADGVDAGVAAELAHAAGGRIDRARLLAADPDFETRRHAWSAIPGRLDGSGAVAAVIADELIALLDTSVKPLQARQADELAALEERNRRAAEVNGKVGRAGRANLAFGVKEIEERHRRELRRQRTDELRSGLATLSGAYRDRLLDDHTRPQALDAIAAIDKLGADLAHYPGELLALQALLVRVGRPPA